MLLSHLAGNMSTSTDYGPKMYAQCETDYCWHSTDLLSAVAHPTATVWCLSFRCQVAHDKLGLLLRPAASPHTASALMHWRSPARIRW